ncbi:Mce family protein, Mce5E [Mycobacteroides abscessus subsp. massiliense]|nr:Mce family protein, Mce5E [Mycobacteroides abscessus subsp. massiliense]
MKLAGADVGQVDDMRVSNYTAITTLRILDGVRLPKGSTAELRSATPLGDVFVSIRPPAGAPAELGRARLQRRGGAQSDQCHQRFRQGHRRSRPGLRRPHQRLQSPTGDVEYAIGADLGGTHTDRAAG